MPMMMMRIGRASTIAIQYRGSRERQSALTGEPGYGDRNGAVFQFAQGIWLQLRSDAAIHERAAAQSRCNLGTPHVTMAACGAISTGQSHG